MTQKKKIGWKESKKKRKIEAKKSNIEAKIKKGKNTRTLIAKTVLKIKRKDKNRFFLIKSH